MQEIDLKTFVESVARMRKHLLKVEKRNKELEYCLTWVRDALFASGIDPKEIYKIINKTLTTN